MIGEFRAIPMSELCRQMRDRFEEIEPGAVDRLVDEWYEAAPLFPGSKTEEIWREFPAYPFNRSPRGKR